MQPKLSVVVATYNRLPLLLDLLKDFTYQNMPADEFEVLVIDDGSSSPVAPRIGKLKFPYTIRCFEQANAGAAVARHRGVLEAQGEIVVFVDDDMHVQPDFLAQHLREHERGLCVVQGHIAAPGNVSTLPLFERFHAYQIERFVGEVASGQSQIRGVHLCTGNLSLPRQTYLDIGGFDTSLQRSEDRELGIRCEAAKVPLVLSTRARSVHRSDHDRLDFWLRRSFNYGVYDLRIAKKHPESEVADPWRFFFVVSPLSRPFLAGAVLAPDTAVVASRLAMRVATLADRLGLDRAALAGTTLCYGIEYFRGVRREAGSLGAALFDLRRYLGKRRDNMATHAHSRRSNLWHDVKADYQAFLRARAKYNGDAAAVGRLPKDVVQRIGVQMMVAVRIMQALHERGVPLAPKVASRLIRHLYAAEIHWQARLAPGITIIHGNGLVISKNARVEEDCILFHHVTLGEGIDPRTREVGAPSLERGVHVGPGASLIGPITIGAGSKIMAGAVLARSVPAGSLVRPPEPSVTRRVPRVRDGSLRPGSHAAEEPA